MENRRLTDRIRDLPPIGQLICPDTEGQLERVTGYLITENAEYVLFGDGHMIHRSRIGEEQADGSAWREYPERRFNTMHFGGRKMTKILSDAFLFLIYLPVMWLCYVLAVLLCIKQKIRRTEGDRKRNGKLYL